jgi:2-oxoglutarate ferredoxin oxidoreductase subunit beta
VKVIATSDVPAGDIVVHDAHSPDPTLAFAISRLTDSGYLNTSPIGIFRQVERPTYDDAAREQVAVATNGSGDGATADRTARLAALISGGDTWTIL